MVKTPPANKGKQIIKVGALSYAQLIKFMLEGVYSCEELAEHTGLHYVTVLHYTRALHKAGACYISSWGQDTRGRDAIKIYSLGIGWDVPRQERMTVAERTRRYRAKLKSGQLAQVMGGQGQFVQSANGRIRFEAAA
jgi:hypothetical protein